jgi:AraC-like DNA-binding protein
MASPRLREGFTGQDMYVIPRPVLARASLHPLVRALYPTDIGWFPEARYHFRRRDNGAPEDHLMMCIAGHGFVNVAGNKNHLHAGELLIIPRDTRHTYWAADDAPWSIYWMHFLGEEASYYLERLSRPGNPVPVDEATQTEAIRLFRDCLGALESGYALPTLIYAAQSARHILSLLLFRNQAFPMEQRADHGHLQLDSTLEFMRTRLSERVKLEEFANYAGLSVSHFSELFRNQTGQSPMSFFTQLKIRQACRLLDLTEKPVKVVAIETGYNDPYYFSRVFKKVMGVAPEKYRAIKKG